MPKAWRGLMMIFLVLMQSFTVAFGQSSQATYTQVVNKATPTITMSTSAATITYGDSVQITATLKYSPDGVTSTATPATGTVTFYDGGTAISGGSVTVSNGVATLTIPRALGGNHTYTASYSGDSNFNAATAATGIGTSVNRATPTIVLATSKTPEEFGRDVTFTATAPLDATGTITFKDGTTTIGTADLAVNGANTEAKLTTSTLAVGSHSIVAEFAGDTNWTAASSSALTQVINKADSIMTLAATPNSGPVGTNVTFDAMISTGGPAIATGETVVFTEGATTLNTATVTPVTTTNLMLHSDNLRASAWKVSNATVDATAAQGPTTNTTAYGFTTTAANGYVYQTLSGLTPGSKYTFSFWLKADSGSTTATIGAYESTWTAIGTKNCTVTTAWSRCDVTATMPAGVTSANFSVKSAAINTHTMVFGGQVEAAANVGPYVRTTAASATGAGAKATFSTNTFAAGTHTITGTYSGNGEVSTSNASVDVTIGKADAGSMSVTLTSSKNPSAYGEQVTFEATVATIGGIVPTGTITFKDGSTTLGTGTLDASGKATFATSALLGGSHSITASYAGDANYSAATSSVLTQTVNTTAATVTVAGVPNPSTYGDTVTVTVTVSGVGVTPTGTVSVTIDGTAFGSALTLDASGKATFTTNSLTAGSHSVEVTYSGDQNYR